MRIFQYGKLVFKGSTEAAIPAIADEPVRLKGGGAGSNPVTVYLTQPEVAAIVRAMSHNPAAMAETHAVRVHAPPELVTADDLFREAMRLFKLSKTAKAVEDPQWA